MHDLHANTWQARKAKAILQALVQIANNDDIPYDFYISKMIWGVSLYLESGDYKENWKTRLRASDAAIALRSKAKDWKRKVTFEHSRTLYDTFEQLKGRAGSLTIDEAAKLIAEYPPVLITKEENDLLNKAGFKKSGVPELRYKDIKISTFELRSVA